MPNHVTNKLIVECDDETHSRLLEAIAGRDEEGESVILDFNRLLPMPECLRGTVAGGSSDIGLAALTGHGWERWIRWAEDPINSAREFLFWAKEFRPESIIEGQKCLDAYKETGFWNWYDWTTENWGTKWNAYGPPVMSRENGQTVIEFDTAWSVPGPVLKKLSEVFPGFVFTVKYFDEGSNFWGIAQWLNGGGVDHQRQRGVQLSRVKSGVERARLHARRGRGRAGGGVMSDELIQFYLADIHHGLLDYQEEQALARAVQAGDRAARDKLVCMNLRLVVSIATKYGSYGVPLVDLIQEGNVGLMRAVDKFDPARGYRLSTYASWWILQSVVRAVANGARVIRLPVHIFERRRRARKLYNLYLTEHGEAPTMEELTRQMNARKLTSYPESIATVEMLLALGDILSLDEPVKQTNVGGELTLFDFVAAEEVPDALEAHDLGCDLREVLESLSAREAKIIKLRYGLEDGQQRTFEQVGRKFGLTRERIRQIEKSILERLRGVRSLRKWIQEAA